jgi:hypothetical protein
MAVPDKQVNNNDRIMLTILKEYYEMKKIKLRSILNWE